MKILHVGLCVDYKNEGLPFALKEASTFYHEINTGDKDLQNKITRAVNTHDFDFAFFQIQSPGIVHPFTFHNIEDKGVFTINWSGDMRNGTPEWYYNTNANLTLFSNTSDVNNLKQHGLATNFLQIGIDPKVYNKHKTDVKGVDIVYMGNNYRNQFPEGQNRLNMIHFLRNRYGNRFTLLGNGWPFSSGENNANQLEQSIIYNNSKIGINFSQFNSDRYTSDRMFRILGSGCMCLSHHYKGIEKDFEVGKHLDTFRDLEELQTKINYYLGNPDKRKEIAFNGYRHCHDNFTYKSMVENLISLYKQYK